MKFNHRRADEWSHVALAGVLLAALVGLIGVLIYFVPWAALVLVIPLAGIAGGLWPEKKSK